MLSIIVASDLHLGINERDPILKNDAQNTFEEIFKLDRLYERKLVRVTSVPTSNRGRTSHPMLTPHA